MHYLIEYDQRRARLINEQAFEDSNEAIDARFLAEARNRAAGKLNIEVVVLSGPSADAIRVTHSRYFRTVEQSAQHLSNAVPADRGLRRIRAHARTA